MDEIKKPVENLTEAQKKIAKAKGLMKMLALKKILNKKKSEKSHTVG